MNHPATATAGNPTILTARLLSSERITPATSREEVLQLVFQTDDPGFAPKPGSCIRVLAPGQYGNRYHPRLYSLADLERTSGGTRFSLCVRRCFFIDEVNGEQYRGVASNYLCDLKPESCIEFSGPVDYPFSIPDDPAADLLMIGMGTGIAPFRSLIRNIYAKHGSWKGKVRLFHGARTGLELLYLNDINNDLANYYDQPTFKAFQAVSPRPAFDAPAAIDHAMEQNAAEVWQIVNAPGSRVYVAGMRPMLELVDKAMSGIAGSADSWQKKKKELDDSGRWLEMLY
jgi:ferredoxin--NADP+ reductase